MKPLLQIALDLIHEKKAIELAGLIASLVDILEVGTPLLKAVGVNVISVLRTFHPQKLILADTKTMDVGALEAELVFEAGADIMSVCAAAPLETIKAALDKAKGLGKKIVVDFIGVKNKFERAVEISPLNPDYFGLHTAIDVQIKKAKSFKELALFKENFSVPLCVAGGIRPEDIPKLMFYKPAIIVVGGFVTKAKDPKEAVLTLKKEIEYALSKNS
jgi:3-hexulose-6-phosphate synthase